MDFFNYFLDDAVSCFDLVRVSKTTGSRDLTICDTTKGCLMCPIERLLVKVQNSSWIVENAPLLSLMMLFEELINSVKLAHKRHMFWLDLAHTRCDDTAA